MLIYQQLPPMNILKYLIIDFAFIALYFQISLESKIELSNIESLLR
jgi:hypothetical protein